MQQPTPGKRRPLEYHPAQSLEREVVRDRCVFGPSRRFFKQPVADGFVKRVRRFGVAAATYGPDEVGVEPALQHGRRRHHLKRGLLHSIDPAFEQATDAGRRALNRPLLRGADVLHDKQGQPTRLSEQARRIE